MSLPIWTLDMFRLGPAFFFLQSDILNSVNWLFLFLGNSTVLIALITAKGRKSRMNFFIKHLAAADLCVGLISVLTDIIWKITISWDAGIVVCKLIRFLQVTSSIHVVFLRNRLYLGRTDVTSLSMRFGKWGRGLLQEVNGERESGLCGQSAGERIESAKKQHV